LDFSNIPSPEKPPASFPTDILTVPSAITANMLFLAPFEFQNPVG
jgi:hypothetical protein